MTDQPSTQLYFLVGLVAALVLVPLVALAATTSPAAVQDGATFNATSGPEVTAGEDMNVATNNLFPDSETVRLGPVTVSHAGQLAVTLTGADTGLPTITPQASSSSDLTLAHDNTSLSATVTGGSVDSLSLSDAATVGDSARDIEIDTGGTGTTLTVAGLTTSQVTFVDTSGSQNQELATKSVSGGTASLSVSANAQRDILLAPSGAAFDVSLDSTNGPVVEGDNLTATATVNNTGGVQATQSITLDAGPLGTTSQNVTLASGGSQTVTLSLPTTTGDAGTVTAQVSSDDDSASQSVDILRNVPIFRLNVTSSNAPITRGDTLSLEVLVENAGAKSGTQTVTLTSGGTVLKNQTVTLASGATQTLTFGVNSSTTPIGATATLTSDNETISFAAREDTWNLVNEDNFGGSKGPVALSPTGERVAVTNGSRVEIYDPQTETLVETVTAPSSQPQALDWHPTDGELAIGAASNLIVYDLEANTVVETINYGQFSFVQDVEFSPDGARLLAGGYLYDADTVVQIRQEAGVRAEVAWSADSQRFALGQSSGRVDVYELGTQEDIFNASKTGVVSGLAFARGGESLLSLQNDDRNEGAGPFTRVSLNLFDVGAGELIEQQGPDTAQGRVDGLGEISPAPNSNRVIIGGPLVEQPARIAAVTETGLVTLRSFGSRVRAADWSANGDRVAFTPRSSARWSVYAANPVIKGQVTDAQGTPVENVTVDLGQGSSLVDTATTNASGRFTLVAPEPGDYTVAAVFVEPDGSSALIDRKPVTVPADGVNVPFTITRVQQGVAGTVVDSQGNPIGSATVTADGTTVDATAGGDFIIPTTNGSVTVTADAPDFGPNSTTVTVLDDQITGGVVLQLEQITGFPVSGTVQTPGGDPIEGAEVFASGQVTQTDASGGYSLSVPTTGNVTVTAATAVDSATKVVNVTTTGATANFTLNEADGGDGSDPPPGNLEIRFENTGELVNNRTVTVRFFDDSEERLATRNTTTGIIDLGTVNETPPLVAVGEADGLFTRRIVLEDLRGDTLFLLDEDNADNQIVINDFDIDDNTGQFSNDVRFRIKRATPLPGETDNIPLRVIGEDLLGADGRFGIALESDVRYRIQVENGEGDVRDLGPHFAVSEGLVRIEIGEVSFDRPDGETFRVDASLESLEGDTDAEQLNFELVDGAQFTDSVSLEIYERSNKSNVLVDKTFAPETGDAFGAFVFTETLTGNQTDKTWVVEYSADRNEAQDGLFTVSATGGSLGIPLDQGIQQVLGVGMVIVIAGLFSTRNAAVGAVVVPLAAGTLWFLGFLSGATTGAAVALALTLGVAYNFATGGV